MLCTIIPTSNFASVPYYFLNHHQATEQSCLNLIKLAFPSTSYRKRDGVGIVSGITIKALYKPSYAWDVKAVRYSKQVLETKPSSHCERLSPIIDIMKKALNTKSDERVNDVVKAAFPESTITWSKQRQKQITGVGLRYNHDIVPYPVFLKRVSI